MSDLLRPLARAFGRSLPARWWGRRTLRFRLTFVATALFTVAVATGAGLLLELQRYALVKVLDQSAVVEANRDAKLARTTPDLPGSVLPRITIATAGIADVQIVDSQNRVIASSSGADAEVPLLTSEQLSDARNGSRLDITGSASNSRLRVLGLAVDSRTVLVVTDLSRVDDSIRILSQAALIGGPLAVLLMASATYTVVALTLRPVAALRHGAADITAAGLADQRLPVPGAQDEIHRLAVTLNAMLDRIELSTKRQRTFVGDAAHELRSPLASLRVQLEVAHRLGPATDSPAMIEDVLVDVSRLERLVADLLVLARLDERRAVARQEPVDLSALVRDVVAGYGHARVPVSFDAAGEITVTGDPDGLRRVAVNLIDNAVRHARAGVSVTVGAGSADGPSATLVVADDGPGIPEEERERVFDRFYRVNASRSRDSGGTGLGLPIVRDLVRAHGGSVRLATPSSGTGLEAVVVLPAR